MNIDKIKELGTEWQKGDRHRVYFDDLPRWYGLRLKHYHSGHISNAWLDGEEISNSAAKQILSDKFRFGCSVWYDLTTGQFGSRGFDKLPKTLSKIVSAITEAANA